MLDLQETKEFLRVDGDDEDALISSFMSKAAPTVAIWFRLNLTPACLIRQRKGLKITKFITRKFIQ